jgi:hypothetical protein
LRRVHASGLPFGCWCGKVVIAKSRGESFVSELGPVLHDLGSTGNKFQARLGKLARSDLRLSAMCSRRDSACADLGDVVKRESKGCRRRQG